MVIILALASGGLGACTGWQTTAEARLDCCADGGSCPMHRARNGQASDVVTRQAQADTCCAASDRDDAAPTASVSTRVVELAKVFSPISLAAPPTWTPLNGRCVLAPFFTDHVPKHVLLSVFLI